MGILWYGGFQSIWVPLVIIHLRLGFFLTNHPAIGVPHDYGHHHIYCEQWKIHDDNKVNIHIQAPRQRHERGACTEGVEPVTHVVSPQIPKICQEMPSISKLLLSFKTFEYLSSISTTLWLDSLDIPLRQREAELWMIIQVSRAHHQFDWCQFRRHPVPCHQLGSFPGKWGMPAQCHSFQAF